jgi:hypothetical protein
LFWREFIEKLKGRRKGKKGEKKDPNYIERQERQPMITTVAYQ